MPWFSRHYRVLTFDPRGNGLSDRPADPAAYAEAEYAADALAVLDATGTDRAAIVGHSRGAHRGLLLAADHPERVTAAIFIGPALPLNEGAPSRFEEDLGSDEGWARYNAHSWRRDYRGFLEFFSANVYSEPHSTKQIEDFLDWSYDVGPEGLIASQLAPRIPDRAALLEVCSRVRCPMLVIHGEEDAIMPVSVGEAFAEATGAQLAVLPGSGHGPQARAPVKVNHLIEDFLSGPDRRRPRKSPHPRALFISSPIGLGHAQRDLAIVRELRARRPELEIHWLAQHPLTAVLEAAGETIHPASRGLANESAHIEMRSGEHELHVFQTIREMDEIMVANFMLFDDVVREDAYDLWIGDEAWELDFFLHENPELKTTPYVFLTDFVGWLPVDAREATITADYNAENIGHVEGLPGLRDAAVFVGEPEDLVPDSFGPGLPTIRDWVPHHFDFSGYVLPFDPADYADSERLKVELGFDPRRPLIVGAVGGSAVGAPLLQRIAAGFAELRPDVPRGGTAARLRATGQPRSHQADRRDARGRLRPRSLPDTCVLRPGNSPRGPDHDDGASREPQALHLRATPRTLRAKRPRRVPAPALRRTRADTVRAHVARGARPPDARATRRCAGVPVRRARRRSAGSRADPRRSRLTRL